MPTFELRVAVLFALLVLGIPAARGGEETAPRDLAARAASFAAPNTERAFAHDLNVLAGGTVVGTAHIEARAEPFAYQGATDSYWRVRECITIGEGEDASASRIEAWLDRSLDPVQGRTIEGAGSDPLVHAFRRVGKAFEVKVTGAGREARTRRAVREGHALLGLTSLVLLAREIAGHKGAYSFRVFAPDWELLVAEKPFVPIRIQAGPGRWQERDVYRLHMSSPADDRQATVVLDPESLEPLYIHWQPPGQPAFDLRPSEHDEPGEDDAVFDETPRTPLAAAMRTTLAFITADAGLFESVVHWSKLQEYGKSYVRGTVSAEVFKKAILAQFEKNVPPPMPVLEARRRILKAKALFRIEMQGKTRARVTLPDSISPMRLTLERIGDLWYLVRLPHD